MAIVLAVMVLVSPQPAHGTKNPGESEMYVVMVEFAVESGQSEDVVASVRGLIDTIVQKQDGFQLARIHHEIDGGKVVNYMQWTSKEAFDAFRAAHKDQVSAAVGKFGPKFSFYRVVHSVERKQ